MSVSTKQGDSGFTRTLGGRQVPKYHLITEAVGAVDEANSFLGLARASSEEKRIKRIILFIQRRLFAVGAELSRGGRGGTAPKTITEADLRWIEKLIEDFEEALALPPGFVAFGQERSSSQLDVARTSVRKAERLVVKMKSEGLLENPFVLKYMNRLSDLLFLLASFSDKNGEERRRIGRYLPSGLLSGPAGGRRQILVGSAMAVLLLIIISLLLFHGAPKEPPSAPAGHIRSMEQMHR